MGVSQARILSVIHEAARNAQMERWHNRDHWRQERDRQKKAADIERMITAKVEQALRLLC